MTAELAELARLGSATIYEAAGRKGLIDLELRQIVPHARVAGPARPVRCGQDDNLMVHAVMGQAEPGDVLVLTMPEARPVALVGELLATQAKAHGIAAILVDAAVRDVAELISLGLPIWTRWVRIRGATKSVAGSIDEPVSVGGQTIRADDVVVLDADGAAVIPKHVVAEVLEAALAREARERVKREQLAAGALSLDLDGLRGRVPR